MDTALQDLAQLASNCGARRVTQYADASVVASFRSQRDAFRFNDACHDAGVRFRTYRSPTTVRVSRVAMATLARGTAI